MGEIKSINFDVIGLTYILPYKEKRSVTNVIFIFSYSFFKCLFLFLDLMFHMMIVLNVKKLELNINIT